MNRTTSLALAIAIGLVAVGLIHTYPSITVGISTALMFVWCIQLHFMINKGAPSVRGTPSEIFRAVQRSGYRMSWQARILFVALMVLIVHTMAFQLRG
jgi:hypothetical protein